MRGTTLQRVLTCVLILKVTLNVILVYRDYLPPNFKSDFLQGRQAYFSGGYQWAFYSHVSSAPCSLVMGMVLLSEQFRRKHLVWHRCLGRIQVACVLLLVTPSGLWMARYAQTGIIAGTGFATLAVATGLCVACGWRSAVNRRTRDHRRWMWRCFLLLCSAIVLRLMSGLGTVAGTKAQWLYPVSAWTVPLLAMFEPKHVAAQLRPKQSHSQT